MLKYLLFRSGEFSHKLETRSRQAVLVNTTEYVIRRTLRISSHLFATNTHFPLYPPSSGNLKCASFVNTVLCFYPLFYARERHMGPQRERKLALIRVLHT